MKKAPNFGTLEKDTIGGVTAMIIDNVKVYTPEKTFVNGGIILENDRICHIYTAENKPADGYPSENDVLDGEGA